MPVTFDPVSGKLDADIVDGNVEELEKLFREGITKEDFNINSRITRYKIRRHTSGKITSFDSGVNRIPEHPGSTSFSGIFENNWNSGAKDLTYVENHGDTVSEMALNSWTDEYKPAKYVWIDPSSTGGTGETFRVEVEPASGLWGPSGWYQSARDFGEIYEHLNYPYELLGFPGGSLHYDFQEQGFGDPDSYFAAKHSALPLTGWSDDSAEWRDIEQAFPENECWSRWLTIPQAGGSVFVDEPCVAVITAQVTGNYFFTPVMRVHGLNTLVNRLFGYRRGNDSQRIEMADTRMIGGDTGEGPGPELETSPDQRWVWSMQDGSAGTRARQAQTVLDGDYGPYFSPTRDWERMFDGYGADYPWPASNSTDGEANAGVISEGMQNSATLRLGLFVDTNPIVWEDEFKNEGANDDGYNPWIGSNPNGKFSTTRDSGTAETRSWKKVSDISFRVRQRHTYKVIGAVELKGRRRYNFSLKYRPAMNYGFIIGNSKKYLFKPGPSEIARGSKILARTTRLVGGENPAWKWKTAKEKTLEESYFYPGGDLLATNMIESSSLSVEFFYGDQLIDSTTSVGVLAESENHPEKVKEINPDKLKQP